MLSAAKNQAANVRECLLSELGKKNGEWVHLFGVIISFSLGTHRVIKKNTQWFKLII